MTYLLSCNDTISRLELAVRAKRAAEKIRGSPSEGVRNVSSDRLSKAFTNLGRIIKTQYILRYLTDLELRQTVQLQLNKGEYRHKLPRRIFFADQGEFTTGDYEEIMNNTFAN